MEEFFMKKKYILVTGASRGIGRSIALLFASQGYHVFINCSRSMDALMETAREIQKTGGFCTPIPADIGKPDEVRSLFRQIYTITPQLDVLVNNAGIAHIGLLSDMSDEEWDRIINTNLSSVFYCCREAIPPMVHEKSGRIINISSMWGTTGASCEAAYSASKSGIHGLTRALAKELAPSNIQVNAIACGAIDTEMNHFLSDDELLGLIDEIPMNRLGKAEEVADLAYHLAYKSSYLTGQIIALDGGWI